MRQMIKLSDVAGTKYFIDANEGPFCVLQNALNLCTKDGRDVEIDVAGCRFGPTTARKLSQLSRNYRLRNTENKDLDEILRHNYALNSVPKMENAEILKWDFQNIQELSKYLREVRDSGLNYELCQGNSQGRLMSVYVAILILLAYPEVIIDADTKLSLLYDEVRKIWLLNRKEHDVYNRVVGSYLMRVERNENGLFEVPMVGEFKESEFVSKFCVLPEDFGNSVLVEDEEFAKVFKELTKRLVKPKRREPKLKDLVTKSH